jgi:hypothetical protein
LTFSGLHAVISQKIEIFEILIAYANLAFLALQSFVIPVELRGKDGGQVNIFRK